MSIVADDDDFVKNFYDINVFWLILNKRDLSINIFFSIEAITDFFCFDENETKNFNETKIFSETNLFFNNNRSSKRLIIFSITFSYFLINFIALFNSNKFRQTSCFDWYFFQRIKYSISRAVFFLLNMFFNSKDFIKSESFST